MKSDSCVFSYVHLPSLSMFLHVEQHNRILYHTPYPLLHNPTDYLVYLQKSKIIQALLAQMTMIQKQQFCKCLVKVDPVLTTDCDLDQTATSIAISRQCLEGAGAWVGGSPEPRPLGFSFKLIWTLLLINTRSMTGIEPETEETTVLFCRWSLQNGSTRPMPMWASQRAWHYHAIDSLYRYRMVVPGSMPDVGLELNRWQGPDQSRF